MVSWLSQHTLPRRLLSILLITTFAALMLATAVIWVPLFWLLGWGFPASRSGLRCLTFISLFLFCEVAGILASTWLWLRYAITANTQSEGYLRANSALQYWWADTLRRGAERLFRLRFEITGQEALEGNAAILLPRHTSIGDTVLPMSFYAIPKAFRVRYVLKRELLMDPCLDIVGNRLPNVFLNRVAEDMGPELSALSTLAATASEQETLIIYMEGTRFSTAKRQRLLESFQKKNDQKALRNAEQWTHLLPIRPAGALALMAGAPDKDLVFFAHSGFEKSSSFASLFNGGWMDTTVKLKFWRIPASSIPADDAGRRELLINQWHRMQDEVDAMHRGVD